MCLGRSQGGFDFDTMCWSGKRKACGPSLTRWPASRTQYSSKTWRHGGHLFTAEARNINIAQPSGVIHRVARPQLRGPGTQRADSSTGGKMKGSLRLKPRELPRLATKTIEEVRPSNRGKHPIQCERDSPTSYRCRPKAVCASDAVGQSQQHVGKTHSEVPHRPPPTAIQPNRRTPGHPNIRWAMGPALDSRCNVAKATKKERREQIQPRRTQKLNETRWSRGGPNLAKQRIPAPHRDIEMRLRASRKQGAYNIMSWPSALGNFKWQPQCMTPCCRKVSQRALRQPRWARCNLEPIGDAIYALKAERQPQKRGTSLDVNRDEVAAPGKHRQRRQPVGGDGVDGGREKTGDVAGLNCEGFAA